MPRADHQPLATEPAWLERLIERAQSRRGIWLVVAIGCALSLPSLAIGLATDDRLCAYAVRSGMIVSSFFRMTTERVELARQTGMLSWWTNPELSIHFFRPLSALTHYFEYRLYPSAAWAMHLVNVLLYAALVALAWQLYRRLLPTQPRWAAFAALLFTVDESHAPTIGWISGRNTLLASLLALAAFGFHVRARESARRVAPALASAACVALALCSAEAGLAVFAYLLAYALVLDTASARSRALSLLPALGVIALWAFAYLSGGYGARGAGLYRDLSAPLSTAAQGLADVPTWLFTLFGPDGTAATLAFPTAPVRIAIGLLLLPLLAALFLALPRTRENRFFLLGALFCLPPLFMTLPQGRLLILASFGAFGLLASFLATARHSERRFVRGLGRLLFALHVVVAPVMFPLSLKQTGPIEYGARAIADAVPRRPPAQVVFVQLPFELLTMYGWQDLLDEPGRALPRSIPQLYAGASPLVARRLDARTLELEAENGWAKRGLEHVFSSLASLPRAGDERDVASIRIRVAESDEAGHPRRVQFQFPDALESSDRLWFTWRGMRLEPWRPPAIGSEVRFEPLSIFSSLKPF